MNVLQRWTWSPLLALCLLVAACGGGGTATDGGGSSTIGPATPGPAASAPTSGTPVAPAPAASAPTSGGSIPAGVTTFEYGQEVPLDQRQSIEQGVALARQHFSLRLGAGVKGNTRLFASEKIDSLVDAYIQRLNLNPAQRADFVAFWGEATAAAASKDIFVYTGARGWGTSSPALNLENSRLKIIAHEYFHVLQHELMSPSTSADPGPRWLLEGAAELIGVQAIADAGLIDLASNKSEKAQEARSVSATLRALETLGGLEQAGSNSAYTLGFVAVDFLTRTATVTSLVAFWDAIGRGSTWQSAFQSAFGTSVDAFYAEFESFRATTLPPLPRITGVVSDALARPFSGIHVYACSATTGSCGQGVTATDGTYAIGVPDATYVVQFGRTSDGNAPDGFYSNAGFTAQRSNATPIQVSGANINGVDVRLPFTP